MSRAVAAAFALGPLPSAGAAQAEGSPSNPIGAPPAARITAVQYCGTAHEFRFTLADGSRRAWDEFSGMLKVDGSPQGPPAGTAMWGPGGRILVIFAGLEDLKCRIVPGC